MNTSPSKLLRTAGRRLPLPLRRRLVALLRDIKRRIRLLSRSRVGGAVTTVLRVTQRTPKAAPLSQWIASLPEPVATSGAWYRIDVTGGTRYLLTVKTAEDLDPESRVAVVRYRYISEWGRTHTDIDHGKAVDTFGPHDWLPRVPRDRINRYLLLVPPGIAHVDVSFSTVGSVPVTVTSVKLEELGPRTEIAPFEVPDAAPRSPLRIALIADTFTVTALRFEAEVLPVTAKNWRRELEEFRPDLLFVESAWNGNDGEWLYCVANIKPTDTRLQELTEHVRSLGIPVLFWNKEDPAHYDDFLAAARLCDVVGTTDANVLDRYRADLGHDRVFALPFCIQPDIHNPRQQPPATSDRINAAAFLGSWWAAKFDDRRAAQEQLFEGSLGFGLQIFDRYLTWDDHERYRMAPEWLPYVHGSLSYEQALNAYRRYAVLLNVNTVADSPTMFSRRALEASACGAVVVTNPSEGTTAALGDLVVSAADADECRAALQGLRDAPDARALLAHRAYRHVHRHHTWANRLNDVATACNIALPPRRRPKISAVLATKRQPGADRILRYLAALDDPSIELEAIVICAFDPGDLEAQAELEAIGARVERELEGETLGECLNRGAALATGSFIAKIDDDDLYGPNYFGDLVLAAEHSRADVVGKRSHYQYFEINDTTVLRYPGDEHRDTTFVCGSTLLARASVYEHAQFPSRRVGEDTEFLRRVTAAGLRIYSADRFNYVSMRRTDLESHTWQEDHAKLLRSAQTRQWGRGLPILHIEG